MTKTNLIIKYNLQDEVDALLDNGYSTYSIKDVIRNNYSDKPELSKISHMAIQRYKETRSKNKLIELDESGEDLVEFLKEEYKNTTDQIKKELKKWSNRIDDLYKKAEQDGSYSDLAKVIQQANKTLMDQLKLSESKMFHLGKQVRNIGDINQKKVQNLNIIMVDIANDLCPDCRIKALNKLKGLYANNVDTE